MVSVRSPRHSLRHLAQRVREVTQPVQASQNEVSEITGDCVW